MAWTRSGIRVYHYQQGNEVGINQFMAAFESMGHNAGVLGLKVHYFTNLCLTYEDLKPAVAKFWETMFEGIPLLPEKSEFEPIPSGSASRDVTVDEFFNNPRLITPHFFISDHPITKELEKRKQVAHRMGLGFG